MFCVIKGKLKDLFQNFWEAWGFNKENRNWNLKGKKKWLGRTPNKGGKKYALETVPHALLRPLFLLMVTEPPFPHWEPAAAEVMAAQVNLDHLGFRPALCSPVQVLSLSYDLILSSKEKKKWRDSHIKSHCQDKMCVLVRVQSSQHTWTVVVGSTVLNAHLHPIRSEPQIIHIIDTIPQPQLSLVQPSDLWLSGLIHSLDHLHTHFLHDNTWPDLVFRWDTLLLFASCLGQSFLLPFFPIAEAVSFSLPDRMPLLLKPCL